MNVVAYLLMMLIWNGILRIGSLRLEGLEGILIAIICWIVAIITFVVATVVLLIQGNFTALLYMLIGLAILDVIGHFYFNFISKYEIKIVRGPKKQ